MKLKTLLLASAAAMIAVSAQAADLLADETEAVPTPAPAVAGNTGTSVCDALGAGFFYIPGTETCLKIGGAVESRVGYASLANGAWRDGYATVEARMDIDTRTESEFGVIGSKFRVSLNHGLIATPFLNTDRSVGLELAYITVGPAFIGYKETLFNTNVAYGDTLDIENWIGGYSNTLTTGFLVDNLGGGFYVGGAIEGAGRSQWAGAVTGLDDLDFVARTGIAGQSWGGSDLSFIHSKTNDTWMVKSTTDFNVLDGTQARFTAAYLDVANDDAVLIGLGAKQALTEQVSAFAGGAYLVNKTLSNPWLANVGVVYTPVVGFDVSGEFGYGDLLGTDSYNTTVKFTKSF